MVSILFVCLGNICRSPAAEGVLRHISLKDEQSLELHIESCGLGDWHAGRLPDERMREAAKKRGVILSSRAQMIRSEFFDRFDLILAADNKVLNELYRYALTPDHKAKLHYITHFSGSYKDQEIPDPYYEGEAGFEHVLDMIEDSCEGLLQHLKKKR
jgi:protein-tyrosine phosphatase